MSFIGFGFKSSLRLLFTIPPLPGGSWFKRIGMVNGSGLISLAMLRLLEGLS
jgi:hypothetical protein